MARSQNQGLQIAVIIFFMLTIGAGVASYVLAKKLVEAQETAKTEKDAAAQARLEIENLKQVSNDLREWIGFADDTKKDTMSGVVNTDLEPFEGQLHQGPEAPAGEAEQNPAEGVPAMANKLNYRNVLQQQQDIVKTLNQQLQAETAALQVQLALVESMRPTEETPMIKQYKDVASQSAATYAAVGKTYDAARSDFLKKLDENQRKLGASQTAHKTGLAEKDAMVAKLFAALKDQNEKIVEIRETTRGTQPDSIDIADGKVTWVNQADRTVYINLGFADALVRQTTFGVYPHDVDSYSVSSSIDVVGTGQVSDATHLRKGTIEVVQVLSEHQSVARIIDDSVTDPILVGDKIYTPLWSPGRKLHVALAGVMDADGDGRSDLALVLRTIARNNAVVDAHVDEAGKKQGRLTEDTDFLILGSRPTGEAAVKARVELIREAEKNGIQKMSLPDLLARMGWKNPNPVAHEGIGSGFTGRNTDGVQQKSTGTVSPKFQPRRPPTSSRGSTY